MESVEARLRSGTGAPKYGPDGSNSQAAKSWPEQTSTANFRTTLQAMLPKEATLGSITLGRWLKNGLVDAPIDGLVMRSARDRKGVSPILDRGRPKNKSQ